MKLGRKAVKQDSRTLKLASYMPVTFNPPEATDWTKGTTQFGMMMNDQLGDCTIAGAAHAIQVWSLNTGTEVTIADADIVKQYSAWDGYVPNDPNTDHGGIELEVLTNWRNSGFLNHKLFGFTQINIRNIAEVKQAINLFGGIYIGIALPISAQTQVIWDTNFTNPTNAQPGSWGGHCVYIPKYDANGFTCITWGGLKSMTNNFWQVYVDEAYALIGSDWLNNVGIDPQGFDLQQLTADLSTIR